EFRADRFPPGANRIFVDHASCVTTVRARRESCYGESKYRNPTDRDSIIVRSVLSSYRLRMRCQGHLRIGKNGGIMRTRRAMLFGASAVGALALAGLGYRAWDRGVFAAGRG